MQNVQPIRTGSTGMTNLVTMLRTICWNSSRTPVTILLLFHVAERPTRTEKNSADMTGMICGIVSSNTTGGSSLSPSTSGLMFRNGRIVKPAPVAKNAAPIDERYAMMSATTSMREALLPSLVMDGAIKPMMISGTQKLMNWLLMNFTVTMMLSSAFVIAAPSAALSARPTPIPTASATRSLNGRLCVNPVFSMFTSKNPLRIYTNPSAPSGMQRPAKSQVGSRCNITAVLHGLSSRS